MHGSNDVSRSQNQTLEAACGGARAASGDLAHDGIKLRAKREGNTMWNDAKAGKGCVAEKKILTRARKED